MLQHLCPWHGLGVHGIVLDCLTKLVESTLEQPPRRALARATGTHYHHAHPLIELLVELKCLMDLGQKKKQEEEEEKKKKRTR